MFNKLQLELIEIILIVALSAVWSRDTVSRIIEALAIERKPLPVFMHHQSSFYVHR